MRVIKSEKANKGDMFLRLTLLQIIIAVCIFSIIVIFAKSNEAAFADIKEDFRNMMSRDFSEEKFFQQESASGKAESAVDTTTAEDAAEAGVTAAAAAGENGVILLADKFVLIKEWIEQQADFSPYELEENPVMPVNGSVTSDYGYREHPISGGVSFHSGRDIAADEGTDIYAALDGTVIATGVGSSSGNYVKIEHEGGLVTLYCHCSTIYVSENMKVRKGDVIASVGQTGLATGPHLHFEVRVNGELSNPDIVLKDAVNVY